MKVFISISALVVFSACSHMKSHYDQLKNAHWMCQCFESPVSTYPAGLVKVDTGVGRNLREAEEWGLRRCGIEVQMRPVSVARCHFYNVTASKPGAKAPSR